EDWVDDLETMNVDDLKSFTMRTTPVHHVLTKIRKLTVAITVSTTILLPLWRKLCQKLVKTPGMLARDVRTRWNSTNDMLASVLKYHPMVEAM
ncbi:hypothetical protein BS47DRAFT_1246597, partial [Hydnum rufescens UP504]